MTLGRIKARGVMGLCVGKVMEHKQQKMEHKNISQCRFRIMDGWQYTPDLKLITAALCCIWVLYMYWHAHDLTQKCKQTAEHSWELQDLKPGHYAVQRAYKSTRAHTQTLPAANSLWSSGCLPSWDRFVRVVTLASDQHNIFCNMFENVSICTCTLAISWDPWPICIQVRKKKTYEIKHNIIW